MKTPKDAKAKKPSAAAPKGKVQVSAGAATKGKAAPMAAAPHAIKERGMPQPPTS